MPPPVNLLSLAKSRFGSLNLCPPGQAVEIVGYLVRRQRKVLEIASEIHDENAIVYARAWGRFVPAPAEMNEQWQSALHEGK